MNKLLISLLSLFSVSAVGTGGYFLLKESNKNTKTGTDEQENRRETSIETEVSGSAGESEDGVKTEGGGAKQDAATAKTSG